MTKKPDVKRGNTLPVLWLSLAMRALLGQNLLGTEAEWNLVNVDHASTRGLKLRQQPRLLALLAILASVWVASHATAAAKPAKAEMEPGARDIRVQLLPRHSTTLTAGIGARISRLSIPEGGRFRAGQTLVTFDCALHEAQINKARADQDYSKARAALEANGPSLPPAPPAEPHDATARPDQAALPPATPASCSITAPHAGRVAEQRAREWQYVQPGQAVLDIIDDTQLRMEFSVPGLGLAGLLPGHVFTVAISETGKNYPARVQRTCAREGRRTQSLRVSAVIDGRFPELLAGMSGKVLLNSSGTPTARLPLPLSAGALGASLKHLPFEIPPGSHSPHRRPVARLTAL